MLGRSDPPGWRAAGQSPCAQPCPKTRSRKHHDRNEVGSTIELPEASSFSDLIKRRYPTVLPLLDLGAEVERLQRGPVVTHAG